jgi:predicted amidohydrolase
MIVSLCQVCSTRDVDANLETCRRLAERSAERGADWILFPENAPFLGSDADKLQVAEPLEGPIVDAYRAMARETGTWLTLGSFPEESPDAERTYNTQVLIAPDGTLQSVYRKIYLFDVSVEGGREYRESDHVRPGREPVVTRPEIADAVPTVGLTICYDLRFPSLYRAYALDEEADIVTVPSAFTLQTGRDHWHPLLRARAIENQCWMLAPNQWGHHHGDRWSYGHSAVYDPWGQRVACAPDGTGIVTAEVDLDAVGETRRKMPCLEHARTARPDEPSG